MRKETLSVFLLLYMQVVGCMSIPPEHLSSAITEDELSDHVHFLAQPALGGRKPRTWQSATVRRYLKNRFDTHGMVPWAQRKGYEQSFGFGTNIIGVLPGTDPNLADEIVIIAAHYDHLGRTKDGLCLGACDNASGVAALLEIAEQMALSNKRSRRPVCFASFDCEERFMLGSFIFTCQEDFDESKIAAVVNIDLLGRDFLDVVDGSLFVIGTGLYPKLRAQIVQAGKESGTKVLPIGTDLVGPRSDHVPFETMQMPVLFFTCGLYKDYHEPNDTPDKLDYIEIKKSTALIAKTVDLLANSERIEAPVIQKNGDKEELQALLYLLETVESRYEEAGLNAEQAGILQELAKETQSLLNTGEFAVQQRRPLVKKVVRALLPVLAVIDPLAKEDETFLWMSEFYIDHRDVLTEQFRNLVRHMLENKPGLFRKVQFEYQAHHLADDGLSFTARSDGKYELHVIMTQLLIDSEIGGWIFKDDNFQFGAVHKPRSCIGDRGEIIDFCLMHWREDLEDESYSKIWRRVLETVAGDSYGDGFDEWLKWRLKQARLSDEKKLAMDLMKSDNPELAGAAAKNSWKIIGKKAEKKLSEIITDKDIRPDIRCFAIVGLGEDAGSEGLLALTNVLDDEKPRWSKEYLHIFDDTYPFSDSAIVAVAQKWWKEKGKSATVGVEAEKKLKELTDRNFGKNQNAWRKWIKANVK